MAVGGVNGMTRHDAAATARRVTDLIEAKRSMVSTALRTSVAIPRGRGAVRRRDLTPG
jgi:hypothetical protein